MGSWPATIPASAEAAARKWPEVIGLIEGERQWTFAEVWADARRSASAMLAKGIAHGDRVAIWAPNSRAWILLALGAQIAGAAIVPLNTRFKGQEAADILRVSRAKLVFAPQDFLGQDYKTLLAGEDLPDLEALLYSDTEFESFLESGAGADDARVDEALAQLSGDDVSDIIFTSGTTGRPKGAVTTHGQVMQTFGDWTARVGLREGDQYLLVNPFFHTFGYKAGWVNCFTRGATIIPMAIFDGAEIVRQIERHRVTFLPGPPTIYLTLLQELAGDKPRDFSSLRAAVTGGAPVAPTLIKRMRDELGIANVVNGYGMTECGVIAMTRRDDDAETIAHSCGYPMPGMEVRCIDDDRRMVPVGEEGEIVVRGPSVMQGYLDDPVATAEAIDPDGWFHTGDIGFLNARGYLHITDRKKDMYISGGFNCYPAEIEKLLAGHPSIETAAVIGVADERMGEVGAAFVVLRPGMQADAPAIIAWSRENMANYKVPRQVVFVDALPRNEGGKVLRPALRDMLTKEK